MSNCELTIHSNPDAQAWAKYFIHKKEEKNWQIEDIDESLMTAWFANAMMAMHDHLGSQRIWVDLTDEEIDNINYTSAHMLAREVLAKLKEKNT